MQTQFVHSIENMQQKKRFRTVGKSGRQVGGASKSIGRMGLVTGRYSELWLVGILVGSTWGSLGRGTLTVESESVKISMLFKLYMYYYLEVEKRKEWRR